MRITKDDWDKQIWEFPNVKANHPEKTAHPCQFPIELVQRCVLALTNKKNCIIDPFMGVGSTIIGASMHDRNAIGYEMDASYISITKKRIKELEKGTIKIRKLGKPIHVPKKTDKVAQLPFEWLK